MSNNKALERMIIKSENGLIDLSRLKKTNIENIYLTDGQDIFNKFAYYNGFDYIPINPFLYEVYGVDSDELIPTQPEMKSESMIAAVNKHKNRVKLMRDNEDWLRVFSHIDEKIGLAVLIREFDNIPDSQKYDCFINIYQKSDFGFEILKEHYKNIFSFAHLSEERNQRIESLREKFGSERFTIHHGVSYDFPVYDYYSWTLSPMIASFFAFRYSNFGEILEKEIQVSDAIDYLDSKGEDEILFSPSDQFLRLMFNNRDE